MYNLVSKSFMKDLGLIKTGDIFSLRTEYDTSDQELKDLLIEPHDNNIDIKDKFSPP